MEMNIANLPRSCVVVTIGFYVTVWTLGATAYFGFHSFDAMTLLGIATIPASFLVSSLNGAAMSALGFGMDVRTIIEFLGFLVFGSIQYALAGYFLGIVIRRFARTGASS